ncbi:hypothetical protein K437DRAFT_257727 [Tilletiaria anomala UBC 951]|uniref:Uncharacterized protein n=1 Tax=Tilletiaria anomala (strain ATCC 24038 / CBS 436.72 / UBC 951) TaxID=1037660 RepID=A0A066VWI5_TILAU|nr:uncharacterized protein K437DRAFT_257727 [Tilletiaria anomala UBC 951]KDN42880.1 hypothetical protein K437DRAFT_257727 [Tilletiaria anomala UBC 951]
MPGFWNESSLQNAGVISSSALCPPFTPLRATFLTSLSCIHTLFHPSDPHAHLSYSFTSIMQPTIILLLILGALTFVHSGPNPENYHEREVPLGGRSSKHQRPVQVLGGADLLKRTPTSHHQGLKSSIVSSVAGDLHLQKLPDLAHLSCPRGWTKVAYGEAIDHRGDMSEVELRMSILAPRASSRNSNHNNRSHKHSSSGITCQGEMCCYKFENVRGPKGIRVNEVNSSTSTSSKGSSSSGGGNNTSNTSENSLVNASGATISVCILAICNACKNGCK